MIEIDLSDSNYRITEGLVRIIFSSPEPKQAVFDLVHNLLDHPFVDNEMRNGLIQVAASRLNVRIRTDDELADEEP